MAECTTRASSTFCHRLPPPTTVVSLDVRLHLLASPSSSWQITPFGLARLPLTIEATGASSRRITTHCWSPRRPRPLDLFYVCWCLPSRQHPNPNLLPVPPPRSTITTVLLYRAPLQESDSPQI
jgi:hypothetical protein